MRVLRENLSKVLLYTVISIGACVSLYPFFQLFVFATLDQTEIFNFPPRLWFGASLIDNWFELNTRLPFVRNIWNSVYIAVLGTGLTLGFSSLAGYAFACYSFRLKEILFGFMLSTMMVPRFVTLIPWFILVRAFGWLNEPKALYIPSIANAFAVFLMRSYIESAISGELMDAARIDGCSEFGIYSTIVMPLVKPGLGALGIITFVNLWNAFLNALVILQTYETYTIPVALRSIQGTTDIEWGALMVGSATAVLPMMITMILFSRHIIAGLTSGALKG